jgi:hypothetical protein
VVGRGHVGHVGKVKRTISRIYLVISMLGPPCFGFAAALLQGCSCGGHQESQASRVFALRAAHKRNATSGAAAALSAALRY